MHALFVANYIIEYSNKKGYKINNLKLQKLLYFVNVRNILENGAPLLKRVWKSGSMDRLFLMSIMNINVLELFPFLQTR
ncbi:phage protein [Streptococcus pyogenes]|nr:phage protein [Streptococcus pyogenes]